MTAVVTSLTGAEAALAEPQRSNAGTVPTPADDPFYRPPTPLPPGEPGDVIRSRQIAVRVEPTGIAPVPVAAWQVLYRSTSATGKPIAVTGTVLVPRVPWLAGTRPLVSYAVGTHGLGDQCAPSYKMRAGTENEVALIAQPLMRGWAVVLTDYPALGTPDVHHYAVGRAAGQAMLDAARAAQRLPGPGLSPSGPVGFWGYSQGGQAAAFAGELQPSYAPELKTVGAVAGGVPRDLIKLARYVDGGPFFGLALGAIAGYRSAYPDLPYDELVNDKGRKLVAQAGEDCVATMAVRGAFHRLVDLTTVPDVLENPAWRARLTENRPGQRKPTAPVLLYHGDLDELIPYHIARPLLDDYCRLGATVEWKTMPVSEHISGDVVGAPVAVNWLANRFLGTPAGSSC
ncbi:lipase family protein [Longimycelium tulufanense]|uniref:lipase family protein n=1 Tax=Longimycelium tulufanense TaxID=907463 RepID=UPI001E4E8D52|nr:lipase family protein [Longimycelium tulufanense]